MTRKALIALRASSSAGRALRALVLLAIALALSSASIVARRQAPAAAQGDQAIPPISYTCPMHPDVVDDKPGQCPICKMELEAVRLEASWTCPVHAIVHEAAPGKCRFDKRDLVPVTAVLKWTCPTHPEVEKNNPGKCPLDFQELVLVRKSRAHGDHNPKHGGQFFMASDKWHHLEGTYPEAGVFRMFVYDDYTKPLPVASFGGSIEVAPNITAPLKPSADGRYLEARFKAGALPVEVSAKVRFDPKGADNQFDFSFPAFSQELPEGDAAAATGAISLAAPAPESITSGVAQLNERSKELADLIAQGSLDRVFLPALQGKEIALWLESRSGVLNDERRRADVSTAVRRLVRAAWTIDLYGDLGAKDKLNDVYKEYASAISELSKAYAGIP